MEPLPILFGFLGAGGLAVLLRIILGYASKTQSTFQGALQDQRTSYQAFLENQRKEFETFLDNHMSNTTKALDNLVHATERLSDNASKEHEETRQLIRDQARIVRDGHRKLGQLLQANRNTAKVGRALDEVMVEQEEKNNER
jgi:hypothetical protein